MELKRGRWQGALRARGPAIPTSSLFPRLRPLTARRWVHAFRRECARQNAGRGRRDGERAPGQQAFTSAVYGNVPLMLVVLAISTFLLLARALRSVILALKAVVLKRRVARGHLWDSHVVWQDGHGSSPIFGIPATGAVTFWVPITVFAFLFGLSMDYEVFILTRVREEYDAGHSDE